MTKEEQDLINIENDTDFKKLCEMLEGDNLLSFFEIEKQETKHSRALAKLFNPSDYYWDGQFIEYLVTKAELGIPINNYSSFEVQTEYFIPANNNTQRGFIDILLYSEENGGVVIVIENKIDSGEHSNQLQRYYDWIEKNDPKFKNYKTKRYIFLTKTGEAASQKNWKSFSYKQIIDMLEEIVPTLSSCSVEMKSILNQYKQFIRRNIAMDKKLEELYAKIFKKYPNVMNGINTYFLIDINRANRAISDEIERVLEDLRAKGIIYGITRSSGGAGSKCGATFTFQTNNLKDKINQNGINPVKYVITPETAVTSTKLEDNFFVCYGTYDSKISDVNIKNRVFNAFGGNPSKPGNRILSQDKSEGIRLKENYSSAKQCLKSNNDIENKIHSFLDRAKRYEDKY